MIGWAVTPPDSVELGQYSHSTGRRSLKIAVNGDAPGQVVDRVEISQRIDVRKFAGQEMVFECDLLAEQACYGAPITIQLQQYRQDGSRILEYAVDPRWLTLELAWQPLEPLGPGHSLYVHLVGADGVPLGQRDRRLDAAGHFQPDQVYVDRFEFPVFTTATPGTYPLIAGVYVSDEDGSWERLTTEDGSDSVTLSNVSVEPSPLPSATPAYRADRFARPQSGCPGEGFQRRVVSGVSAKPGSFAQVAAWRLSCGLGTVRMGLTPGASFDLPWTRTPARNATRSCPLP